jgi:hypothetical protein
MSACGSALICMSFLCFLIGVVMFLTRGASAVGRAASGTSQPAGPDAADRRSDPAPTSLTPARSGNSGQSTSGMQDKFASARLGQTVTVKHPERGPIPGKILGSIRYTELWQRTNSPSEPWVPTGNEFTAHWFGNFLIYQWQERLYLLDEYEPLSDQDVQATFMPPAKQFAQSNQTAQVTFAYPPSSWTIADIGKFSVARAEGEGLRLRQGATGRFIHSHDPQNRALVVEDYQSGSGGQDTAWLGWKVGWDDILKIG